MVKNWHILALGALAALVNATPKCSECTHCFPSYCPPPPYPDPDPTSCPEPSQVTVTHTVTHTVPGCCPQPEPSTVYVTVYTTDVQVSVSTDWATETIVKTTVESYPVTVTTSVCTGPEEVGYPEPTGYPTGYPNPEYGKRAVEVTPPKCVYYTTTIWKTKTIKKTETIEATQTVHVPTTHYEVSTEVQVSVSTDRVTEVSTYSTITTYTTTYTYTSLVPTTVVEDHTEFLTETYTEVSTYTEEILVTETVTSGYTATETLPAETVTLPASTITTTVDGEEVTITLPPGTLTVISTERSVETLPGSVTTLPGETITTTFTETEPPTTITITEDGEVITSVIPGPTVTFTTTIVLPRPPVTACPAPTNVPGINPDIAFDPVSNRTFGCAPGFVCNPPKPGGCNLWADPPLDEYVCKPKYCIRSPPYSKVRWPEEETGYYPPDEGYFNLNPNAFGLPFSIFEYETYVKKKHGKKITITTGNWASATELSVFPPPTPLAARIALPPSQEENVAKRYQDMMEKRQDTGSGPTAPAMCFDDCNNCYKEALAVGKTPELCVATSVFREFYGICIGCIALYGDGGLEGNRRYVDEKFAQFLNYCDGQDPDPVTTTSVSTSVPPQETAVTSDPDDVETTSQEPAESDTSADPIPTPPPTTSSNEEPPETSTPSPTSTPPPTSTPSPTSTPESTPQPAPSSTGDGDGDDQVTSPTSDPAETDEPTSTSTGPEGTNTGVPGDDDDEDDDVSQPGESGGTSTSSESDIPSVTEPSAPSQTTGFEEAAASLIERSNIWVLLAPVLALILF